MTLNMRHKYLTPLLLLLAVACSQEAYDLSRGIDREVTLFTDQVSMPVADIGPLSPKQLLEKADIGSMLETFFKEDEEGYLVAQNEETVYSNPVLLLQMGMAHPSQPTDVDIPDFSGKPGEPTEGPSGMGLMPALQVFTLYAVNPLTEEMGVSGKLTISAKAEDENPEKTLFTKEFNHAGVTAKSENFELYRATLEGMADVMDECKLENLILHLPASIQEKDPLGGWSSISLGYRYKAYLEMGVDFPMPIPIPINNLKLPLGQFKVKDVLLLTEVSNEIPITLVLESVDVMTSDTEGNSVECEDVSITPGVTIASGCTGAPVITPLAVTIRAKEGTIPDITGLQLNLSLKAPAGAGDKRLNMNQTITFNHLRVKVSGGITIQGR